MVRRADHALPKGEQLARVDGSGCSPPQPRIESESAPAASSSAGPISICAHSAPSLSSRVTGPNLPERIVLAALTSWASALSRRTATSRIFAPTASGLGRAGGFESTRAVRRAYSASASTRRARSAFESPSWATASVSRAISPSSSRILAARALLTSVARRCDSLNRRRTWSRILAMAAGESTSSRSAATSRRSVSCRGARTPSHTAGPRSLRAAHP